MNLSYLAVTTPFIVAAIAILNAAIDRSAVYQVNSPGVVVITGATSGLGRDAAFFLANQGFHVLAGARSEKKAKALEAEYANMYDGPGRLVGIVLDVANEEHHAQAVAHTRDAMEQTKLPFTGLVNNAGVHPRQLLGEKLHKDSVGMSSDLAMWRSLYEVNVFSVVGLTRRFDGLLREHKARIVNVGSVAGEVSVPGPGSAAYHSSKWALRSLTDIQRAEFSGAGVSVSLVAPGYVKSGMCDPEVRDACGRLGPEETTTPVYFDALVNPRPKSKYIVAHIGGGWTAAIWAPMFKFIPSRILDFFAARIAARWYAKAAAAMAAGGAAE